MQQVKHAAIPPRRQGDLAGRPGETNTTAHAAAGCDDVGARERLKDLRQRGKGKFSAAAMASSGIGWPAGWCA